VIVAGKSYDKACWQATQNYEVKANNIDTTDVCPICSKKVTGEAVIVAGKGWHRVCYTQTHPSETRQNVLHNEETCPRCKKPVTPGSESVVDAGKSFHRACFSLEESYGVVVYN